jgi:hypothetical protein
MRKRSHSPDRVVIPSRSHPSPPFSLDFQLSTVNFFLTASLEGCVIISGIAPPFSLDFQLSTVNFFLTPLQSALPQNAPITRLESALPNSLDLKSFRIRTCKKWWGEGVNC